MINHKSLGFFVTGYSNHVWLITVVIDNNLLILITIINACGHC